MLKTILCLKVWLIGILLLLSCGASWAQAPPDLADSTATTVSLQERLAAFAEEHSAVVGLAIGVVDADGRLTASAGSTSAGGTAITDSTVFEIASITKTFTGLVLAHRVEEGRMAIDDPLTAHLPDSLRLPEPDAGAITLRHLTSHTSGLPRLPDNLNDLSEFGSLFDPYSQYEVADLFVGFETTPLQTPPGSTYAYSNFGAGLLGALLAREAGTGYGPLIRDVVTGPLGMDDTMMDPSPLPASRRATPHTAAGRETSDWTFTDAMAGTAALSSSVADVLRYLEAQVGLVEVDSTLRTAIERSHTRLYDAPDGRLDVAYGWHTLDVDGRQVLWHNGGTFGSRSFTAFSREAQTGVVFLSNATLPKQTERAFERLALTLLDARIEGRLTK